MFICHVSVTFSIHTLYLSHLKPRRQGGCAREKKRRKRVSSLTKKYSKQVFSDDALNLRGVVHWERDGRLAAVCCQLVLVEERGSTSQGLHNEYAIVTRALSACQRQVNVKLMSSGAPTPGSPRHKGSHCHLTPFKLKNSIPLLTILLLLLPFPPIPPLPPPPPPLPFPPFP